jgi:hypothetical protein
MCVHNEFQAYGTFGANCAPILRQDYHYLQTDRNGLPLEPRHLGVSSGAFKTYSDPVVYLAQTVHLFTPTLTPSPNRPKEDST